MSHTCPLVPQSPVFAMGATANWREDRTCSGCGSLHPDLFFEQIERGATLVPTDKSYKVYVQLVDHRVRGAGKFYFQHLSAEQMQRFVDLMNAGTMQIGYPGHFYVPPFFVATRSAEAG